MVALRCAAFGVSVMKRLLVTFLLCFGLAAPAVIVPNMIAPSVASAEILKHEESRLQIFVPDDWVKDTEDEDLLTVHPKDESVGMFFLVVDASDFEAAMDEVGKELDKIVKDFKEDGEAKEDTLNGLKVIYQDGTGKIEGKPADVGLMVILAEKTKKVVIVFAAGEKGKYKKHEPTLTKIFKSIKAY